MGMSQVEVASLGDTEEDTATVETKILQLRKNKGTMKLVAGRPLQLGDVAIVDFGTVRTDTNEEIPGSQRKGMQLDTGLGDRAIGLVGMIRSSLTYINQSVAHACTLLESEAFLCTEHLDFFEFALRDLLSRYLGAGISPKPEAVRSSVRR